MTSPQGKAGGFGVSIVVCYAGSARLLSLSYFVMNEQLRPITLGDLLLWLLRRRKRFRVTGRSMTPLLRPGDEILIDPRAYWRSRPSVSDIVIACRPDRLDLRVIKRVKDISADGSCFLTGDNLQASTDSRTFGWVSPDHILGRVICRFL